MALGDVKNEIIGLIVGILIVIIGLVAGDIGVATGVYVKDTLVTSINTTPPVDIMDTNTLNLAKTSFIFAGLVIMITAVGLMFKKLWTGLAGSIGT